MNIFPYFRPQYLQLEIRGENMVKGVSKTVIVVNNTGSKLFEKIVFYVTPEYGTLSAKQLKKAASSFSLSLLISNFGLLRISNIFR